MPIYQVLNNLAALLGKPRHQGLEIGVFLEPATEVLYSISLSNFSMCCFFGTYCNKSELPSSSSSELSRSAAHVRNIKYRSKRGWSKLDLFANLFYSDQLDHIARPYTL